MNVLVNGRYIYPQMVASQLVIKQRHNNMETTTNNWARTWNKALPKLAITGPAIWLLAALIRAFGIGTLPGELEWASAPEGVLMVIGVPFFVCTFIFMGQWVATKAHKTGVVITVLGILGIAPLAFISGFRVIMKVFVDAGLDPDLMHQAFESESVWILPFLFLNLGQFLAWVIAGVAVLRRGLAPKWAGALLILGVPTLITAQAAYIALEVLWPLANAFWLLGVWGLTRSAGKRG